MLIDLKRKTIFIAGLKTASTSIEHLLAPHANIRLERSEWGKHDSAAQIQEKFDWLFEVEPWDSFFKWGVIRDPIDMMHSLYHSHMREDFAAFPELYTGNMDFGSFLDVWTEVNADQCRPQSDRFMAADGRYALDLLLPYDMLETAIALVAPRYGLRELALPRMNVSAHTTGAAEEDAASDPPPCPKDPPYAAFNARIEALFPRDMALIKAARKHVTHLLGKVAAETEREISSP